jgi:hypothetical protein
VVTVKRGAVCCPDKQCGARLGEKAHGVLDVKRLAFASSNRVWWVTSTVADVREGGRRAV